MQSFFSFRLSSRSTVVGLALTLAAHVACSQTPPDRKAGFVVASFAYVLSRDASETGACPNGLSSGYANIGDVILDRPDLKRRDDETDADYSKRASGGLFSTKQNLCMQPEAGKPDPNFRTVTGPNVPVTGGIDLDGQVSRANGKPALGTCAHDDFNGMQGERGIDNQFFRVVGCSKGYQSAGQSHDLNTEMLTGTWGVLIALSGVDDLRNDSDIEVGFYANADAIELTPTREPLANTTYTAMNDPRFRAKTRGRIVNGVLTSEPVDVRFYSVFNTVRTERPLRDARVRMTLSEGGVMEGYLAGYTPVEAMYDVQFGFRNGTEQSGAPASLQLINTRSIGSVFTMGVHTCQGVYQALRTHADGHRDSTTGQCTSISTQYRIRAVPAFIVDSAKTE